MKSLQERIDEAVTVALECGSFDGGHHKMWVIDQMLQILLGTEYETTIAMWEEGEDGPHTYEWDQGIPP